MQNVSSQGSGLHHADQEQRPHSVSLPRALTPLAPVPACISVPVDKGARLGMGAPANITEQSLCLNHCNSNSGPRRGWVLAIGGSIQKNQLGHLDGQVLHGVGLLSQQGLKTCSSHIHSRLLIHSPRYSWDDLSQTRCFPIVLRITHKNNKQRSIFYWPTRSCPVLSPPPPIILSQRPHHPASSSCLPTPHHDITVLCYLEHPASLPLPPYLLPVLQTFAEVSPPRGQLLGCLLMHTHSTLNSLLTAAAVPQCTQLSPCCLPCEAPRATALSFTLPSPGPSTVSGPWQ